jgi:hypothetical protein
VGVGISNPAYTLDIGGPLGIDTTWARLFMKSGITNAAVSLSQDGGGNGILDAAANAGQIILSTQGVSRLNVTQGGTIGIGDSGPLGKLGVATTSDTTPSALATWDTRHFVVGGTANTGGIGISYNQSSDTAYIQTAKPNVGYGATVLQPFGGNVGIGVTTPGSPLSVAGDINFSGVLRFLGVPVQQYSLTSNNTSSGVSALANSSLTGTNNTAVGGFALTGNAAGSSNTGVGYFALKSNMDGNQNTAVGAQSLQNTMGTSNGSSGSGNTAIGWGALESNSSGNGNIAIGLGAGSDILSTNNNIDIGASGTNGDNAVIRIGNTSIHKAFYAAGVSNVNLTNDPNGLVVLIDSATGQLGVSGTSSRRYKEDVQDMGDASSGLMRLRPVTFRYKQPLADGSKPVEYGLIAEEVAEVYPELVAHSADGRIEAVRYQVLDSMLLNEVQKQQRQITSLKEENEALQERLAHLEESMTRLTAGAGSQ